MTTSNLDDEEIEMTHYGWIGICPLYTSQISEGELAFCLRSDWFWPLWPISIIAHRLVWLPLYIAGFDVPELPIWVTGRIK